MQALPKMRESLLIVVVLQSAILSSVCEAEKQSYSPLGELEIGTALILRENNLSSSAGEIFLESCTKRDFYDWYTEEISEECRDQLNSTIPAKKYMLYCEEDCGWLYFEFLRSCGELGELVVNFYEELCWRNRKGVPCYYFLMNDKYANMENEVHRLCFPRNTTCPTVCQNALESFSHKLGCCVNNIFNTTVPSDTTQYALWNSCGVSTPLFCEDAVYEDEDTEDEETDDSEDDKSTNEDERDEDTEDGCYEEIGDSEEDESTNEDDSEENTDMEDRSDSEREAECENSSGGRDVYKTFLIFGLLLVITVTI